ncbi:Uncharacterised protein [Chromobacterium violaceum]|uniref:K+ potassium transporter C-terminal domain-containing protein n=1 Tax=Chromobacterium violaceum TaxID=536 RepID=A0A447TF14_CHRVL|nr:Uncharacterised protein [Chromobacterium violaceum]
MARVTARYGYMEEPDVPEAMARAAEALGLPPLEPLSTSYYLGGRRWWPRRAAAA